MSGLQFELPLFYIILFVLLGFALSYFLYNRDRNKGMLSKTSLQALFALRWVTIILLSILILQPKIFKTEEAFEKPFLVYAQDNSRSITATNDSLFYKNQYLDSIDKWIAYLDPFYDIRLVSFGDKCEEVDNVSYSDNSSNIEALFHFVENKYYSTNLTDVIIASDGIFNLGMSPEYLSLSPNIEVHPLLIGDSIPYTDVSVKSVKHNKYALLENKFPIEVTIFSNQAMENVSVLLYRENQLVDQVDNKKFTKGINKYKFIQKAEEEGVKNYRVVVKSNIKESNLLNNSKSTYVEIIDYSQKILILAAAPHPDVSSINWALKDLLKSKVSSFLIDDFKGNVVDYDLVIFHQPFLNSNLLSSLKEVKSKGIPSLVIVGNGVANHSDEINLIGLKKNQFKGTNLTSAVLNEEFNSFNLNEDWKNIVEQYPPIQVPFSSNYDVFDNAQILAFQSINGMQMPYPLVYFYTAKTINHAAILGLGIWRWKMAEFQKNDNAEAFKSIFHKIILYLKKIDKKSRFNVEIPSICNQDEFLNIYAEYYNASFELSQKATVTFNYKDSLGNKFTKLLSVVDKHYELNLYNLDRGEYSYSIDVNDGADKFSNSGFFKVISSNRETITTVADINKLKSLSKSESIHYLEDVKTLIADLKLNSKEKIKAFNHEDAKDIIHYKWLIFIIILFPVLEWLIRKSNGLI